MSDSPYRLKKNLLRPFVVIGLFAIISATWIFVGRNTGNLSEFEKEQRNRQDSQEGLKAQILNRQSATLDSLVRLFKAELEKRNDIGILVGFATADGIFRTGQDAGDDSTPILSLIVKDDWKKISYESRLTGLSKVCALWGSIVTPPHPEKPRVKFIEETIHRAPTSRGRKSVSFKSVVGGCDIDGKTWLEK